MPAVDAVEAVEEGAVVERAAPSAEGAVIFLVRLLKLMLNWLT